MWNGNSKQLPDWLLANVDGVVWDIWLRYIGIWKWRILCILFASSVYIKKKILETTDIMVVLYIYVYNLFFVFSFIVSNLTKVVVVVVYVLT